MKDRKTGRRKRQTPDRTAPGALFQVLEASLTAVYNGDKPPPRKLQRRQHSQFEGKNECQLMWNYLESLAARVEVVEEVSRIRDQQHPIKHKEIMSGAKIISQSISSWEGTANPHSPVSSQAPSETSCNHQCPACFDHFQDIDSLHQHIRTSDSHSHKVLKKLIDQRSCPRCGRQFGGSRDLVRHEQSTHDEQYDSRLDKFVRPDGRGNQHPGNKKVDQSPTKDVPETAGCTPAVTKPLQWSRPASSHSQQSLAEGLDKPQNDSLTNANAHKSDLDFSQPQHDMPVFDFKFTEPCESDIFSYSSLHIFSQPEHDTQMRASDFEFTEPSERDILSYSRAHIFSQPQHGTQTPVPDGGFTAPSSKDASSHSGLHVSSRPLRQSLREPQQFNIESAEPSDIDASLHVCPQPPKQGAAQGQGQLAVLRYVRPVKGKNGYSKSMWQSH